MSNIYIDSEKVNAKLEILRNQKQEIQNNFDNFKSQVEKLQECWTGNSGENAYNSLKKHEKKYEYIISRMDNLNTFLDNTNIAYNGADNELSKFIDESADR